MDGLQCEAGRRGTATAGITIGLRLDETRMWQQQPITKPGRLSMVLKYMVVHVVLVSCLHCTGKFMLDLNGGEMGLKWGIFTALFVFGVCFNWFVGYLKRRGFDEGYVSIEVVFGVAVTALGYHLMPGSGRDTIELIGCFIASGTPMILGEIIRYARKRERTFKRILGVGGD